MDLGSSLEAGIIFRISFSTGTTIGIKICSNPYTPVGNLFKTDKNGFVQLKAKLNQVKPDLAAFTDFTGSWICWHLPL